MQPQFKIRLFAHIFPAMLFVFLSCSQSIAQLRHVKGLNAMDISFFLTRYGKGMDGTFTHFFSKKSFGAVGIYYEEGWFPKRIVNYAGYELHAGGSYQLYSYRGIAYISAIGGLSFLYVRNKNQLEAQNLYGVFLAHEFKYGGYLGAEMECFFTHQISLVGRMTQRKYLGKGEDFGNAHWIGSLGLRYSF